MDIKKLQMKRAQLQSELDRVVGIEKGTRRRDDTRLKIVVGGSLIAAVRAGTVSHATLLAILGRYASERDRKFFAEHLSLQDGMSGCND